MLNNSHLQSVPEPTARSSLSPFGTLHDVVAWALSIKEGSRLYADCCSWLLQQFRKAVLQPVVRSNTAHRIECCSSDYLLTAACIACRKSKNLRPPLKIQQVWRNPKRNWNLDTGEALHHSCMSHRSDMSNASVVKHVSQGHLFVCRQQCACPESFLCAMRVNCVARC